MKYQTVSNVTRDRDLVIKNPTGSSLISSWTQRWPDYTVIAPYAPQSVTKVVPDPKESSSKTPRPLTKQLTLAECKRLGIIKMTPYFNKRVTERWFTPSVRFTEFYIHRPVWVAPTCSTAKNAELRKKIIPQELVFLKSSWDYTYSVSHDFGSIPFVTNAITENQIADAINECKSSVINDQFSGYDLLTEMAEFKETLEFLHQTIKLVINPLKGIVQLRDEYAKFKRRHPDEVLAISPLDKQFFDKWMQYRYAIMPIYYSIKDIAEMLSQLNDVFKTDRARNRILPDPISYPSSSNFLSEEVTGEIVIKAVGKSKYESPELRLSQLITANPFVTAWELVPFSFVIDWFVNIGDWLFSQTSTYIDIASQRSFCLSARTRLTTTRYAHLELTTVVGSYNVEQDHVVKRCYNTEPVFLNLWHQSDHIDLTRKEKFKLSLYERVEDSYDRSLFKPQDVKLSFNPSLSWKRWLDAFALSYKPTIEALRALKR